MPLPNNSKRRWTSSRVTARRKLQHSNCRMRELRPLRWIYRIWLLWMSNWEPRILGYRRRSKSQSELLRRGGRIELRLGVNLQKPQTTIPKPSNNSITRKSKSGRKSSTKWPMSSPLSVSNLVHTRRCQHNPRSIRRRPLLNLDKRSLRLSRRTRSWARWTRGWWAMSMSMRLLCVKLYMLVELRSMICRSSSSSLSSEILMSRRLS